MGVGDGGGGGIQTEIGKSKIIEGVAVSYQDASLPPTSKYYQPHRLSLASSQSPGHW